MTYDSKQEEGECRTARRTLAASIPRNLRALGGKAALPLQAAVPSWESQLFIRARK
jgi:hypothetical protein